MSWTLIDGVLNGLVGGKPVFNVTISGWIYGDVTCTDCKDPEHFKCDVIGSFEGTVNEDYYSEISMEGNFDGEVNVSTQKKTT